MCLGHYGIGWESEFELRIGKDVEGRGRALFQLTIVVLPDETHEACERV